MPQECAKLSLRDIFHMLDNKHLVFVMLPDVMIEKFEVVLAKEGLTEEFKELCSHGIENLKLLRTTGSQADVLLSATKELIYAKINADEKYFDAQAIQQKLQGDGTPRTP